jgi:predicted HicB family RNase H-like nuclease
LSLAAPTSIHHQEIDPDSTYEQLSQMFMATSKKDKDRVFALLELMVKRKIEESPALAKREAIIQIDAEFPGKMMSPATYWRHVQGEIKKKKKKSHRKKVTAQPKPIEKKASKPVAKQQQTKPAPPAQHVPLIPVDFDAEVKLACNATEIPLRKLQEQNATLRGMYLHLASRFRKGDTYTPAEPLPAKHEARHERPKEKLLLNDEINNLNRVVTHQNAELQSLKEANAAKDKIIDELRALTPTESNTVVEAEVKQRVEEKVAQAKEEAVNEERRRAEPELLVVRHEIERLSKENQFRADELKELRNRRLTAEGPGLLFKMLMILKDKEKPKRLVLIAPDGAVVEGVEAEFE